VSFLGGGSYFAAFTEQERARQRQHDSSIRLFAQLRQQGYRILYISTTATTTQAMSTLTAVSGASVLLSSTDYLSRIQASTGECLPAGPIFKSPDSLVRAFGAARTDVFKASALRGVKSLFPTTHNPYHACFCTKESDAIPFARFGFPEGRIFLVNADKGGGEGEIYTAASRVLKLTFPRLFELLYQIFPLVIDSQPAPTSNGETDNNNADDGNNNATTTTTINNNRDANDDSIADVDPEDIESGAFTRDVRSQDPVSCPTGEGGGGGMGSSMTASGSNLNPSSATKDQAEDLETGAGVSAATYTLPKYASPSSPTSPNDKRDTPSRTASSSCHPYGGGRMGKGTAPALEDTYNDFNFWKLPPAVIDDDYDDEAL